MEIKYRLAYEIRERNSEKYTDPWKIHELLFNAGFDVIWDPEEVFCSKYCQDHLKAQGALSTSNKSLEKAVLPVGGVSSRPCLFQVISKQLQQLQPKNSLLVIDPYLLHASSSDFADVVTDFMNIIAPVLHSLSSLTLIERKGFNQSLLKILEDGLKEASPNTLVRHQISSHFHDRFWIVDESSGFFVGTSLNGIGKRYSLTDIIHADDVADIIKELKDKGLGP